MDKQLRLIMHTDSNTANNLYLHLSVLQSSVNNTLNLYRMIYVLTLILESRHQVPVVNTNSRLQRSFYASKIQPGVKLTQSYLQQLDYGCTNAKVHQLHFIKKYVWFVVGNITNETIYFVGIRTHQWCANLYIRSWFNHRQYLLSMV